jgi:hypothetical protein
VYSGNESNTFGTGFIINRKYEQTIMNFEAVEERICSLRMKGKSNNFRIILVHALKEEKHKLVKESLIINIIKYSK